MPGKIYLSRTVPIRLDVSPPRVQYLNRPREVGPPLNPPSGTARKLRMWGFLYYTWDETDPTDFASIACSPFRKGYNWAQWLSALSARILARGGSVATEIVDDGTYIWLHGEVAIDMGSMLNICVLGHSPPKEHIQAIKARSQVGTKVFTGLHNLESCPQAVEWNPIREDERLISRGQVLAGKSTSGCHSDGLNAYGCTCIDPYELRDSCAGYSPARPDATNLCSSNACGVGSPVLYPPGAVGCPHTPRHGSLPANATTGTSHAWQCDVRSGSYHTALATAVLDLFDANYTVDGRHVLDGALFDCHNIHTQRGDSTLLYPDDYTDAAYRVGWTDWDAHIQAQVRLRSAIPSPADWYWANCVDAVDIYPTSQVANRWVEHFFVAGTGCRPWSGVGGIEEALTRARAEGQRIVLGATGGDAAQDWWMFSSGSYNPSVYGDWGQVFAKVQALSAWENVYAQAVRMTSGGWGCWQEGWEPLR